MRPGGLAITQRQSLGGDRCRGRPSSSRRGRMPREGSRGNGRRFKPVSIGKSHDQKLKSKDLVSAAFTVSLKALNTLLEFLEVRIHLRPSWLGGSTIDDYLYDKSMIHKRVMCRWNLESIQAFDNPVMLRRCNGE